MALLISSEAITSPPGESTFKMTAFTWSSSAARSSWALMTSTMLLPASSAVWLVMMPSTVMTAILWREPLSSSMHSSSLGPTFARADGFETVIESDGVRDHLGKITQQAEHQQHDQDNGRDHPAITPAWSGRRRGDDRRRGQGRGSAIARVRFHTCRTYRKPDSTANFKLRHSAQKITHLRRFFRRPFGGNRWGCPRRTAEESVNRPNFKPDLSLFEKLKC